MNRQSPEYEFHILGCPKFCNFRRHVYKNDAIRVLHSLHEGDLLIERRGVNKGWKKNWQKRRKGWVGSETLDPVSPTLRAPLPWTPARLLHVTFAINTRSICTKKTPFHPTIKIVRLITKILRALWSHFFGKKIEFRSWISFFCFMDKKSHDWVENSRFLTLRNGIELIEIKNFIRDQFFELEIQFDNFSKNIYIERRFLKSLSTWLQNVQIIVWFKMTQIWGFPSSYESIAESEWLFPNWYHLGV